MYEFLAKKSFMRRGLIMILCCLALSISTFAQSSGAKITIKTDRISVIDALKEVERQSNMSVGYNETNLSNVKPVSLSLEKASVETALNEILKNSGYTYRIDGKYIIIVAGGNTAPKAKPSRKITGQILDNEGEPLVGASVQVAGTSIGCSTDIDGNFTLDVPEGSTLTVSYLGFNPTTLKVGSASSYSVALKPNTNLLSDVVVTALGIKKEAKALTYNVQEIGADAVTSVKDANFINSLAGKVAGVNINQSSAGIGGGSKVVLRGTKSIYGNNNALYVIDGIPMPSLETTQSKDNFTGMGQSGDGVSMLNPEDIESMSVLSGAAASALYGSDAANGVIMITTKKGQEGRVRISYSNSTQFMHAIATPDFQNTYGAATGEFKSWGSRLAVPSSYDPTDFFRRGYNETNALTLTAGNSVNQTFVSMAATNAEGIIENNTFKRYNFTVRNTTELIKDKLRLDVSAQYMSIRERNMVAHGQYMNPIVATYLMSPSYSLDTYKVFEMHDPSRNLSTQFWPWGNQGIAMQNPYWIINRDNFINHKSRYMLTGGLYWDNVVKGLNLSARAKVDNTNAIFEKEYSATTDAIFAEANGAYFKGDATTRQIYADVMANYTNRWGDFDLTAVLGASINDLKYNYFYYGGDLNSVANHFTWLNVNPTGTHTQRDQDGYHAQTQSIYATAQLGFRSWAYLDLAGRIDWSSALAWTKSSSVAYPSVGLSFILTDMIPAMRSNVLSFLKVRGSYSEVGNAPTRFIAYQTYPYESGTPTTSTSYPNNDIQPERTKAWEVGVSARFWMDKINFNLSLYKTSTYNQLFHPTLSAASGYKNIYINGGQIDNKGIELSLGIKQPLGPVEWTSNFTYTLNRNKVVKLLSPTTLANGLTVEQSIVDIAKFDNVLSRLTEGGSVGDLYVTTLARDYHGHIIVNDQDLTVSRDEKAGPNGDGWIYAGNAEPKYTMGWRNDFYWNGFNLGFLINARIGGRVVSMTQAYMDAYGTSATSAAIRDAGGATINGVFIPGSAQKYCEYVGNNIGENYIYSATNVRLAELTFGYDIPMHRWVKWMNSINVSFVGRNLCYFYKKAPYDPELTASTNMGFSGMDYFMLPAMRTLGFSIKVNL